jgi:hemolysin-activating ACP:hemolysin acyltransferase
MIIDEINVNAHLSWVIDRIAMQTNVCDFELSNLGFKYLIYKQWMQIKNKSWLFQMEKYGNLCAAANLVCVRKNALTQLLKHGPAALMDLDCVNSTFDPDFQLVLLDLWTEVGYGRAFLQYLRDQLRPHHSSIIYFRIKNGKRIAKMLTRDDATTFMRSSKAVRDDDGLAFLQSAAARDFYLPTYNTQMAFAQRVGEMALLMVHAPVAAVSPLKPVLERIQTCAKLEQHKLYSSATNTSTDAVPAENTPTGLVTWAWLTSKRLRAEAFDTNALQAFEWSEGPHLAVVDMVLSPDTEAAVWADLAGLLYPEEDIWLLCKVGERVFFKKWAKHQRKELLTNPRARSAVAFGTWHDITQEPACPL